MKQFAGKVLLVDLTRETLAEELIPENQTIFLVHQPPWNFDSLEMSDELMPESKE